MDSIEKIQADYLRGAELQLNAFNRAMALCQSPMVPIAMQVLAELVEDQGDIT